MELVSEEPPVLIVTFATHDGSRMSAQQYEAALRYTDLGPQIEALLADQSA